MPDGLLFRDAAAKARANGFTEEWKRYEFGLAVVESKRWGRPLDRRSGRRGEETAPSTQMLRYLRRVDDLTTGKLRWGILTNGARWRLWICRHCDRGHQYCGERCRRKARRQQRRAANRRHWNPLSAWWLDSYSLAYTVSSLLNQLFGKGKEPFWEQAYTNLVRWIIELHRVFPERWVTLQQVYRCAIDPELFAAAAHRAAGPATGSRPP